MGLLEHKPQVVHGVQIVADPAVAVDAGGRLELVSTVHEPLAVELSSILAQADSSLEVGSVAGNATDMVGANSSHSRTWNRGSDIEVVAAGDKLDAREARARQSGIAATGPVAGMSSILLGTVVAGFSDRQGFDFVAGGRKDEMEGAIDLPAQHRWDYLRKKKQKPSWSAIVHSVSEAFVLGMVAPVVRPARCL